MGTKRLRATVTETMLVDVDPEEATRLLAKGVDYMDVIDAVLRFRRIAAHDTDHVESDVSLEDAEDAWIGPYGATPVCGDGRERYLWSARHFVIQARRELNLGRYREGNCPDLDAVNRDLGRIEDRLREMAWAVDHPEGEGTDAVYVRSQRQSRNHTCHWPGCEKQVPPAMWGCKPHWLKIPKALRDDIWLTYEMGQEVTMTPSAAYLEAARAVENWIRETQHLDGSPS